MCNLLISKKMKKNIFKKLFIKISKLIGYELIDQNEFYSPTLEKGLDEKLSTKDKSIIIPLGEVKLIKKIKNLSVIFRTNSNIDIWDQNKKRVFEEPKIEYVLRCLFSLIKSINRLEKENSSINVNLLIIDDNSKSDNLNKIKDVLNRNHSKYLIINHKKEEHKGKIFENTNDQTFSNLSSLLKCFETAKKENSDLVYFVEDDYLHFENSLTDMINTYERVSSQIEKDIIICPCDYPFNYMSNEKTNILIGSNQHWRTVEKVLCTFMISKKMLEKYWNNLIKTCEKRHNPFEKYINEILINEIGISPINTLSIHLANVNSSYGLSPFVNIKKLWDENNTN